MNASQVINKQRVFSPAKMAAWWMLIAGAIAELSVLGIFVGTGAGLVKIHPDVAGPLVFMLLLAAAGVFVLYFLPGLLVLKGGKWGWIIASVILFIVVAAIFAVIMYDIFHWLPSEHIFEHSLYHLSLIPFLIPLILILLDHISYKLVILLPILIVITYFASITIVKT